MLSSVNPDSCISAMGKDKSMDEARHCKWLLTEIGDWQTETSSEWSSSSSVLLPVLFTPFLIHQSFNQSNSQFPRSG
jgi:hypothetical protein